MSLIEKKIESMGTMYILYVELSHSSLFSIHSYLGFLTHYLKYIHCLVMRKGGSIHV